METSIRPTSGEIARKSGVLVKEICNPGMGEIATENVGRGGDTVQESRRERQSGAAWGRLAQPTGKFFQKKK